MRISVELVLPRDERSVPLARHIAGGAMREVGVHLDCVSDIEVALTEACTNVLEHSGPGDEYHVRFDLDDRDCVIRVIDTGHGFDSTTVRDADSSSERGRGIALMKALVDRVQFESRPEAGTVVHLHKWLAYDDGGPLVVSR